MDGESSNRHLPESKSKYATDHLEVSSLKARRARLDYMLLGRRALRPGRFQELSEGLQVQPGRSKSLTILDPRTISTSVSVSRLERAREVKPSRGRHLQWRIEQSWGEPLRGRASGDTRVPRGLGSGEGPPKASTRGETEGEDESEEGADEEEVEEDEAEATG